MSFYELDGENLTLDEFFRIVQQQEKIKLHPRAVENIEKGRTTIEKIIQEKRTVYGVNTGFGKFSEILIPEDKIEELQYNLVVSHATGVGEPLSEEIVRAISILKINSLAKGFSGVRLCLVEKLIEMYHAGIIPVIPAKGSVGASGDLAPLAHYTLVLLGMGEAFYRDERMPGADAMKMAGIKPLVLKAKEGLAMLNGLQVTAAIAGLAHRRLRNLARTADVIGALTTEGLKGTPSAFDDRIQRARGLPGQIQVGRALTELLKDSEIRSSHEDCHRVQDAYSLRCMPQVHGAVRDALSFIRSMLAIEINSCTDNPLIFYEQEDVLSGGNFHGQPLSMVSDMLAITTTYLANISERRIEYMLDPNTSEMAGFLTEEGGLNSGFMIAQVTAASLASENKVLAHPASVDSIPTSANKEDYVSMSCHAALKALEVVENTEYILGIELLCACQAIDLKEPLKSSTPLEKVHQLVRAHVPHLTTDRYMKPDIEKARELIVSGKVWAEVRLELDVIGG
ncbi:histidine ammonia-lyase [candidate division KSB1 bacterium]|nr:histidine ammonia-lyase [candidate division KSB1 bacterium]